MIKKVSRENIVKKFQIHDRDTGSLDVQIALLTDHISQLTVHMQENPKDFSTKRGLLNSVGRRKRYLAYLQKKDEPKYRDIISKLGLRK
ncbi:30S ribosomal protein S15 [bacterium]|jgi:small subunit ribosomal protein S15|nr:30S ribosomal protein S15 [bacterium]